MNKSVGCAAPDAISRSMSASRSAGVSPSITNSRCLRLGLTASSLRNRVLMALFTSLLLAGLRAAEFPDADEPVSVARFAFGLQGRDLGIVLRIRVARHHHEPGFWHCCRLKPAQPRFRRSHRIL